MRRTSGHMSTGSSTWTWSLGFNHPKDFALNLSSFPRLSSSASHRNLQVSDYLKTDATWARELREHVGSLRRFQCKISVQTACWGIVGDREVGGTVKRHEYEKVWSILQGAQWESPGSGSESLHTGFLCLELWNQWQECFPTKHWSLREVLPHLCSLPLSHCFGGQESLHWTLCFLWPFKVKMPKAHVPSWATFSGKAHWGSCKCHCHWWENEFPGQREFVFKLPSTIHLKAIWSQKLYNRMGKGPLKQNTGLPWWSSG